MKPGGRIVILDYSVEDTRWEPDRLRISIAFSGPCYTGAQQILGTTWWQRTFQNSSISARLTQVEIHLYGDIAPRGEPDFFDAYTSVIWQYRMQSLGSRIGAWDFLRKEHGIKRNHIMNAIGVDSAAADAFRVHSEARVVEQG